MDDCYHGRPQFAFGTIVQHFKRGMTEGESNRYLYCILGEVEHTETKEQLVLYRALYGTKKLYVRPVAMFYSEVDTRKYPAATQKWRFEEV